MRVSIQDPEALRAISPAAVSAYARGADWAATACTASIRTSTSARRCRRSWCRGRPASGTLQVWWRPWSRRSAGCRPGRADRVTLAGNGGPRHRASSCRRERRRQPEPERRREPDRGRPGHGVTGDCEIPSSRASCAMTARSRKPDEHGPRPAVPEPHAMADGEEPFGASGDSVGIGLPTGGQQVLGGSTGRLGQWPPRAVLPESERRNPDPGDCQTRLS